ncbi:MAG: hypothetical protein GHCLOJNM_01549 [bacterium]|nr:hypothetical protein [bacterium]
MDIKTLMEFVRVWESATYAERRALRRFAEAAEAGRLEGLPLHVVDRVSDVFGSRGFTPVDQVFERWTT